MRQILLGTGLCLLLSACSAPTSPDPEQRPDPQATASPITETANAYKGAAQAAAAQTEQAAKREADQVDAATQ